MHMERALLRFLFALIVAAIFDILIGVVYVCFRSVYLPGYGTTCEEQTTVMF